MRHPHSPDDVHAPKSRSRSLASTLLPAAVVLLAVVLLGSRAWSALPRIAEMGRSGLRVERAAAPLPPPVTRIDDSIFRPLRVARVGPFGYPGTAVDKREIVRLLRERRFKALERRLEGIHRQVRSDIRYEYHLLDAFMAFSRTGTDTRAPLDEWVQRRPGSPHARIALAMHLLHSAWQARGTDVIRKTPAEGLKEFREIAASAQGAAVAGLERDPAHLVGHYVLLNLARSFATARETRRLLDAALARLPDSYALHDEYMASLEPRWGGSPGQMREFGAEAARRAGRNPRLGTLRGAEHVYRAYAHRLRKDYAAAAAEYGRALRYGPEPEVLLQRGRMYYVLDDNVRARADLEFVLQQRPQRPMALEFHARSLYYIARAAPAAIRGTALARAEEDFQLLAAVDPDNDDLAEWLGHVEKLKRWCAGAPGRCNEPSSP